MRTSLRKKIGNPSTTGVPDTDLNEAINAADDFLTDRVANQANRQLETFVTVAGTETYALTSDALVVLSVKNSTNGRRLQKASRSRYIEWSTVSLTTGVPIWYYREATAGGIVRLRLHPIPNSVYTINVLTKTVRVDLVTNTDESILPLPWHRLIVLRARYDYYDGIGDYPKAQWALSAFNEQLSSKEPEQEQELSDFEDPARGPDELYPVIRQSTRRTSLPWQLGEL